MPAPVVELLRLEHDFGERPVLRGVELRIEPAASRARTCTAAASASIASSPSTWSMRRAIVCVGISLKS